jgi:hypothetical protein
MLPRLSVRSSASVWRTPAGTGKPARCSNSNSD